MWTQPQDYLFPEIMTNPENYLLHKKYTPGSILEPRFDAPLGRIWCKHCQCYLVIGAESASHQNLVRLSQTCMDCGAWNYQDEELALVHSGLCASKGGEKVQLSVGGSIARATIVPKSNASQEEAAAWPHV